MSSDSWQAPVKKNSRLILTVLMVISMVVWGGSWVSAKVMAGRLTPEVLSFWRFFMSFVSFVPMLVLLRKPFTVSRAGALYSVLGAIFISTYMYFFFQRAGTWPGRRCRGSCHFNDAIHDPPVYDDAFPEKGFRT
jgi:drug/metabolite transporter (DMT)-like permease